MTVDEFQNKCLRTANTNEMPKLSDHDAAVLNYALGLAGEAGEVADLFKKHFFQGHDLVLDKVAMEIGDLLWYAAMLLSIHGMTLETSMSLVITKLNKRYQDGFSKIESINRVEGNE